MPDASALPTRHRDALDPELTRANKARHAAIDARAEGRIADARCWDAQADKILAAMRRGEKPPLFDLTQPYRG